MNPKAKKGLIIAGLALDVILTITLFVFSIILLVNMPESKYLIDETTFLGWFQIQPVRILICDVIPLALLLAGNIWITIWYLKKNGNSEPKKNVSLNDLSDEEKAALKQKILEEMLENKK